MMQKLGLLRQCAPKLAEWLGRSGCMFRPLYRGGWIVAICATLLATPVAAVLIASTPEETAIEVRLEGLAAELRCLVCQNESLASSHAPLAEDLRREVRAQIRAGKDDRQIIQYLTDRYGDFVTYRPPLKARTLLLWIVPPLLLLTGLIVLLRRVRRRSSAAKQTDPAALDALRREFDGEAR